MIDLVCLGDSFTFGYGVDKNSSWVKLIGSDLKLKVLNKGLNGDTTTGMLSRFYEDVILNKPTNVIILGGTNDFLLGYKVSSVLESIILTCKEAKENNIIPMVACPTPIEKNMAKVYWDEYINFNEVNDKLEKLRNDILIYCSESSIKAIDLYSCFTNYSNNLESSSLLYLDGVHYTKKGHEIVAKFINSVIKVGR